MAKYLTSTAVGPGACDDFFQQLRAHLATNGWTELDVINNAVGSRDVVFRGSALDATADNRPIVRLTMGGGTNYYLDTRCYTDWDPAAHLGFNANPSLGNARQVLQDASFVFFVRANSVSFVWAAKISGNYVRAYCGFLRRGLPPVASGCTKTSGANAAGTTVWAVASDMTGKLYVGQKILIINNAHDNSSANKSRAEERTIAAVAAGTITTDASAGNFDAGAIIGQNPLPTVATYPFATTSTWDGTYLFPVVLPDGTVGSSVNANIGYLTPWDANYDGPNYSGQRRFGVYLIKFSTAGYNGTFGFMYHVNPATIGGAANNEDLGDAKDGATPMILIGLQVGAKADFFVRD